MRTTTFARAALILATTATAAVVPAAIADAAPLESGSLDGGSVDGGSLEEYGLGGLDYFGSLGGNQAPPSTQRCNSETKSGGYGVTETRHILGLRGPTSFTLNYDTYDIPDEIRVFYGGRQIYNTGYVGDDINQGTGSVRITVPPGGDTSVVVRVTGPDRNTEWDYTVNCPGAS